MTLLRKIGAIALLVVMQLTSLPLEVLAQEATPTVLPPSGYKEEKSPFLETEIDPYRILIAQEKARQMDVLGSMTSQPVSAVLAKKAVVHKLSRKDFKASEEVAVVAFNASSVDLSAVVKDSKGEEIKVKVQEMMRGDASILRVLPPSQFKPGKYTLSVTTSDGTHMSQDFTWGVLALNTNKSIYTPGEKAHIAMAVLDDLGKMVCDADVTLKITPPTSVIPNLVRDPNQDSNETLKQVQGDNGVVLSTKDGTIRVNPECMTKDFTLKPDYEAEYTVDAVGEYEMQLTAVTPNGTRTITDTLTVKKSVAFDVERMSATRIYPPSEYPVVMKITAHEDFTGQITDIVPHNFAVKPYDGTVPVAIEEEVQNPMPGLTLAGQEEASTPAKLLSEQEVLAFTDKRHMSRSEVTKEAVLGAATLLQMPFAGNHPKSADFGDEELDPLLKKKYAQYGVVGHDGMDFDLPEGTPILAADDGVIVKAQEKWDYGTTIVIQHSWGKTYYGHLSTLLVKQGQKVKRGEQIALSGNTGLSTGPHLHFSVKPNTNDFGNGYYGKVDPAPFLGMSSDRAVLGTTSGDQSVQLVTWEVSLKKGETVYVGYQYKAPDVSPQFYTLGKLQFSEIGKGKVFEEARLWQIAADDLGTVYPDGDVAGGTQWASCTTNAGAACGAGTRYTAVNETTLNATGVISTGTGGSGGEVEEFTMQSVANGGTVSQVVVKFQADTAACNGNGSSCDSISANIRIGGVLQTAQTFTMTTTSTLYTTAAFTGSWAGDTDLQIQFTRTVAGGGNAANADDNVRLYWAYAEVTYTPPSTFEQSAYRWYNNIDSRDLTGIQSSYTSGESKIWDVAFDTANGHLYTAGYDTAPTNNQWRIEKRNITNGALVTAFGTNGVLQINPSSGHERVRAISLDTTGGYLFIASYDNSPGNTQLNLQKRKMTTGALCTAAECGTEFGTGGIITNNVSSGTDVYETMVLDTTNGYIYLGGYDNTPTNDQWRWEKRKMTTGALCTAAECGTEFGTGGVVTNNPASGSDILFNLTADLTNGYLYGIGQDSGTTDLQWRIEKRKTSSGALCTAVECGTEFGTGGAITINPSAAADVPEDIEVDVAGGYIYIAGWDHVNGNMQWRIEKRLATTGALCTAAACGTEFGTGGTITNNPSSSNEAAVSLIINPTDGYLYAGGDDQVNGNYQFRLEKRKLTTGALCTAAECGTEFGTGGVVQSNPSTGEDVIRNIAVDSTYIYGVGHDFVAGDEAWRMEKYNISNGAFSWGTPLANNSTSATLSSAGQEFRLRSLLHVGTSNLAISGQQFKLQFVGKGTGTCSAPSGGTPSTYTDVTTTTVIAYKDNTTPADAAAIRKLTNDPVHGADTTVAQTYEEANNFTNATAAITAGQDGLWDFPLFDNGATAGTTYCLRVVKSDGTTINTYTVYPEIRTYSAVETPTLDKLLRHGKWFNSSGVRQPFTF